MERINIIGAGIAGLSAAIELSKRNIACRLISSQPSERAQSVLAEGGINAALNVMGEQDTTEEHFQDTMRGGVRLADPNAVRGLTGHAPELVRWLASLGMPFQMENGQIIQRKFGGQKKKRTAFTKSSTGKALVTALIDEARKYEARGLIERMPHHDFVELLLTKGIHADAEDISVNALEANDTVDTPVNGTKAEKTSDQADLRVTGVRIRDTYSGEILECPGTVILCFGGFNGLFPGLTTGTTQNTGDALATVFRQGVELANPEFIQYHPTTVRITGKCMLISEAARGEGGRLYIERGGEKWYFMEEKFPELGNLMPRDVVSREMTKALRDEANGNQVYLDLTGLPKQTWKKKLPDMREEIRHYLGIDPAVTPVPVFPAIHYFMGGIHVDEAHRTKLAGLYAAGECACQYHGANRLGGNSMLGALYGGKVAAGTVADDIRKNGAADAAADGSREKEFIGLAEEGIQNRISKMTTDVFPIFTAQLASILHGSLGIIRNEAEMTAALAALEELNAFGTETTAPVSNAEGQMRTPLTAMERDRLLLGKAMLMAALSRKESRGAHYRSDYPETDDAEFRRTTVVRRTPDGDISVYYEDIPALREHIGGAISGQSGEEGT